MVSSIFSRTARWGVISIFVCIAGCATHAPDRDEYAADSTQSQPPLVTGKSIEAHFAEASQDVGSMPINMVQSADGRFATGTARHTIRSTASRTSPRPTAPPTRSTTAA